MNTSDTAGSPEAAELVTFLQSGTYPRSGERVTVVELGSTLGMLIAEKHLEVRQTGVSGTAVNYVPGHGGDVWFVAHDHAGEQSEPQVGAYSVAEIAPEPVEAV